MSEPHMNIQDLAALCPVQLPAQVPGKAMENCWSNWDSAFMWGTQMEFKIPGYHMA